MELFNTMKIIPKFLKTDKIMAMSALTVMLFTFFLLYKNYDFSFMKVQILKNKIRNQLSQNLSEKKDRSPFLLLSLNKSNYSIFHNFVKYLPNWIKFRNSKKISEEFSKSENRKIEMRNFLNSDERSFEDKCLTTFNRSLKLKNLEKFQNFTFLKTEKGKEYKKILAYYYDYGKSFGFGFGHEPFEAACCKEKRCFITNNKSIIPIEEFDAVLVHFRHFNIKNLPKKRKRHQRWIFYEREPPPYTIKNTQDFEGVFNWTMTYRRDSDIVSGYGRVYKKKDFAPEEIRDFGNLSNSFESVMKTKKKMVVWFVSNCKVYSQRSEYVKELQKFIQVDIYGKCGPLKCDKKKEEICYKKIESEYKFYLAFENNFCKDYVTEKFFNSLGYFIIPVVRGSGDYAAIAPPHSYINALDFKTPKDLANYLIYLSKNDSAYTEYFKWKKDYFVMNMINWFYHATSFCTLCQKLHSDKTEKIYYNLTEWFLREAHCNKHLKSLSFPSFT
ncbi:UNVERIFIED_CONTAM: hypothetical protein RMT77_007249 [Armadillidium vulgare]